MEADGCKAFFFFNNHTQRGQQARRGTEQTGGKALLIFAGLFFGFFFSFFVSVENNDTLRVMEDGDEKV